MDDDDLNDDERFAVSYQGVSPGVPVLTKDGKQFGILEHVMEVPEEDLFDGIVVWIGSGGWLERQIQRELSMGESGIARKLELLQPHHLRFVDADQVAAITGGYIRCNLDEAQAAGLPAPAQDAPLYYANAIDQAPQYTTTYVNDPATGTNTMYGTLFMRGAWRRGN